MWEDNDGNLAQFDSGSEAPQNPGATVFEMLTLQEVPAKRPDFAVAGDRGSEKVGRMGGERGKM